MAEIVKIESLRPTEATATSNQVIDVTRVRVKIDQVPILPASGNVEMELANDHTSEPIKSLEDIRRVSEYLVARGRYRDNMLFILGINFGLRVSDLLQLRFCMLIDEDLTFRTSFPILEKKTRNTRKVKKNRYVTINESVVNAVTLFLSHNERRLDDYMFRSESNNGCGENKPMSRMSVDRILKGIANDLGLNEKISTHSLRKTFGYHQMVMSNNDPRKLLLLQKIFGHSSAAQTLDYIGITTEEIEDAYMRLNLGGKNDYSTFSRIGEYAGRVG